MWCNMSRVACSLANVYTVQLCYGWICGKPCYMSTRITANSSVSFWLSNDTTRNRLSDENFLCYVVVGDFFRFSFAGTTTRCRFKKLKIRSAYQKPKTRTVSEWVCAVSLALLWAWSEHTSGIAPHIAMHSSLSSSHRMEHSIAYTPLWDAGRGISYTIYADDARPLTQESEREREQNMKNFSEREHTHGVHRWAVADCLHTKF